MKQQWKHLNTDCDSERNAAKLFLQISY